LKGIQGHWIWRQ